MTSPAFRRALASFFAVPLLGLAGVAQGGTLTIDIPSCTNPTATVSGNAVTIGCGSGGGGPVGVPAGCSISGPSSVAAGGVVTLQMNCATGNPTSYSWAGGNVTGSTSQTVSATITANTTFTATASNESGSSAAATKTVTVDNGQPQGGVPNCTGFDNTRVIDIPWTGTNGANSQVYSYKFGGFGPNDAIVARITVPANMTKTLGAGRISVAEYLGSPTTRKAALSNVACDFTRGLGSGLAGEGQTLTMWFTVGTSASAMLKPGQTYYYNISNQSCTQSTCNVVINLTPPL